MEGFLRARRFAGLTDSLSVIAIAPTSSSMVGGSASAGYTNDCALSLRLENGSRAN